MTGEADKTAAPEALPQRVEQADHVALVQAQARKAQAEQAVQLAQLRLQLAVQELAATEAARAACAALVTERYQLGGADQIAVDGVIWRAQPAEEQG